MHTTHRIPATVRLVMLPAVIGLFAVLLISPLPARGQMTPEEALRKLHESEKHKTHDAAAADEPETDQVRRDEHGRWKWTDADLKQIEAIRKRLRKGTDGFYEAQTYTWIVRSDVNEQFTAELAWYMQLFAEAFPKIFPCPAGNRIPVKPTIVLYVDKDDYRKVDPTGDGIFRWVYDGRKLTEFTLYSYARDGHDQQFADFNVSTIQHEGTHALVQWRLGMVNVPNWFQEAHATYFEAWDLGRPIEVNRDKLRRTRSSRLRYLQYKILLSGKKATDFLPTLRQMLAMTDLEKFSRAGGPEVVTANYTAAELLMEYVLSDKSRFNYYIQMFIRARDRHKDHLLSEAETRTLEPKWQQWINEQFPPPANPPQPTPKP